jgi:pimeloyl-ACP methyl ester carboxylesterase
MMLGNKITFFLSKRAPWLIRGSYRSMKKQLLKKPEKFMRGLKKDAKRLNVWDQKYLQTEDQLKTLMMHLGEAFRLSIEECVNEPLLLTKPWGFSFREITSIIDLWHGESDPMASVVEIKRIAATIPNCETHYYPEAGHFLSDDLVIWSDILSTIHRRVK